MLQPMQVLTSRNTVEWYTPPHIIELARDVMGSIDLDPATDERAQNYIKAKAYYTQRNNGLTQSWYGNVWLNPPFDDTARWSDLLVAKFRAREISQATLLVNSNLGYSWYERLWRSAPCCCIERRLEFLTLVGGELRAVGQAKRGQTLLYFGPNTDRFIDHCRPIGRVIIPKAR